MQLESLGSWQMSQSLAGQQELRELSLCANRDRADGTAQGGETTLCSSSLHL